jgi:hypothetical protein
MDGRTRDSHAALDGLALPHDDPVWQHAWPPNGFNCRCAVVSMPEALAKARGIDITNEKEKMRQLDMYETSYGFTHAPGNDPLTPHVRVALDTYAERSALRAKPGDVKAVVERRRRNLEHYTSLGPSVQVAISENFSDAVDVYAIGGHDMSSRGIARHHIGVIPETAGDNLLGNVVSVSDTGLKLTYRNLVRISNRENTPGIDAAIFMKKLPKILKGKLIEDNSRKIPAFFTHPVNGYMFEFKQNHLHGMTYFDLTRAIHVSDLDRWIKTKSRRGLSDPF